MPAIKELPLPCFRMHEFRLEVEDGDVTDDITWDPSASEGKGKKRRLGALALRGLACWAGPVGLARLRPL